VTDRPNEWVIRSLVFGDDHKVRKEFKRRHPYLIELRCARGGVGAPRGADAGAA
jgi:hypothetical protein